MPQAFAAFTGNYTLGDLEILHKEGNITEFMAHARDVRPSDRGRHWTQMVQDMAIQLVDKHLKKAEYPQEDFELIEDLSLWPSLKGDEFFQTKRAAFGERYLLSCIEAEKSAEKFSKTTSPCLKSLYNFWNNTPNIPASVDLGLRLGEMVRKNADDTANDAELWSFVSRATISSASEFFCQKEIVFEALEKKIQNILIKKTSDEFFSQELQSMANTDCWKKIIPSFEKELLSFNQDKATLAFRVLKAKGALTNEKKDLFMANYILNGPDNGDLFNEAWTELKNLGQNYKRREIVFEKIKRMDPLPGKVFTTQDPKRKQVLIDYILLNFPEFIDHYAKTCLSYVKGKGSFPKGNPTMECRELVKSSKNNRILNENIFQELSSYLK